MLFGGGMLELMTSAMSMQRSTTELIPLKILKKFIPNIYLIFCINI